MGIPGRNDFDILQFQNMNFHLPDKALNPDIRVKGMSTQELWQQKNTNLEEEAEWQWRLSMPFSIFLLVLTAVPLARIKPRQGKFSRILPAALLYIIYANFLFVGRSWVASGTIPVSLGLWCVHLPMLLVAILLLLPVGFWHKILPYSWLR